MRDIGRLSQMNTDARMKISILRARRVAHVALLKAERRRQQEREAEARFYSNEVAQQGLAFMPCGHFSIALVLSDEGTHYCRECKEATRNFALLRGVPPITTDDESVR